MATIPLLMRAAVLVGTGGPEMLEVRDDVPVPVPAPDEVLIAVSACGVNNTDINTRTAWYSRSVTDGTSAVGSAGGFADSRPDDSTWGGGGLTFPRIQGADPCGRIVAVGQGVDTGRIGQRVLVDGWLRDRDHPLDRSLVGYLGSERDGGFAEYMTVPERNTHSVESTLSDVELASFPCSWSTAEHMLARVDLRPGQTIVITGASGGVGSAGIQLSKRRGARVVAVAGRAKLDAVTALGADEVIARDEIDVPAAVTEAAGGPLDVVFDVVGGDDFSGWLGALRRGGRFVTAGAIAGPVVGLDLRTLYLNDLELYGATVFEPGLFADLVGYIERGEVRPVVAATFPLEEIHAAQEAFVAKQHIGNIVITI